MLEVWRRHMCLGSIMLMMWLVLVVVRLLVLLLLELLALLFLLFAPQDFEFLNPLAQILALSVKLLRKHVRDVPSIAKLFQRRNRFFNACQASVQIITAASFGHRWWRGGSRERERDGHWCFGQ